MKHVFTALWAPTEGVTWDDVYLINMNTLQCPTEICIIDSLYTNVTVIKRTWFTQFLLYGNLNKYKGIHFKFVFLKRWWFAKVFIDIKPDEMLRGMISI